MNLIEEKLHIKGYFTILKEQFTFATITTHNSLNIVGIFKVFNIIKEGMTFF